MLMSSDRSVLLVVDLQQRLLPAIDQADEVLRRARTLIAASKEMNIPVLVSEQYPKGLGHTADGVIPDEGDVTVMEKVSFSCFSDAAIRERFEGWAKNGRNQIVICGTEAHVCVLQTALEARELGYEVFVVKDACTSRHPDSKATAMNRFLSGDVQVVTVEMAVFEWLQKAGTDIFRTVSKLIK